MWELIVHDFRDATDRRAPQRRRHALRRWSGHGPARRTDPRARRGDARDRAAPHRADALRAGLHPRRRRGAGAPWTGFTLLCGRYEGFDQRALDLVVDEEISLGDFVLAGGELAALCVIESVVRLLPGGLGNDDRASTSPSATDCSSIPTTPSPPRFAAWRCPRCCSRAITRASRAGAAPRRCGARWRAERPDRAARGTEHPGRGDSGRISSNG